MLVVSRQIRISRPVDEVQAQFADVRHHETASVHRSARFVLLDETRESCRYQQSSGRGPLRALQTFELDRENPCEQVNTVVAGPFRTGTLTFTIRPEDAGSLVTATLRAPVPGALKWSSPILRTVLGRSLARALVEDKDDLESGRYAELRAQR